MAVIYKVGTLLTLTYPSSNIRFGWKWVVMYNNAITITWEKSFFVQLSLSDVINAVV